MDAAVPTLLMSARRGAARLSTATIWPHPLQTGSGLHVLASTGRGRVTAVPPQSRLQQKYDVAIDGVSGICAGA